MKKIIFMLIIITLIVMVGCGGKTIAVKPPTTPVTNSWGYDYSKLTSGTILTLRGYFMNGDLFYAENPGRSTPYYISDNPAYKDGQYYQVTAEVNGHQLIEISRIELP